MGVVGESSRSAPNCRSPPPLTTTPSHGPRRLARARDEELGPALEALWKKNYSVYGRRKLTKAAKRRGLDCGRDQVERLMKRQGIAGRHAPRGASRPTPTRTTCARRTSSIERSWPLDPINFGLPTSLTARRGVASSTWPSSSTSSHGDSWVGRPVAR